MLKLIGLVTVAALLVGCGGGGGSSSDGRERVVAIEARDDLSFSPASVEVAVGETVRFEVTNVGAAQHEFILGDEETQMAHEEQMGSAPHSAMEAMASITMDPGEMMEATVTFDEPGEILFGCHVDGHYAAGMRGTVTVG